MVIELEVITDIYSKPDLKGISIIVKKNVKYHKQFETNEIRAERYMDSKGNIIKKYCLIKEGDQYYKLNHKYEDIVKLTSPVKIKGYKAW